MTGDVCDLGKLYDQVLNFLLDQEAEGKRRVSFQDLAKLTNQDLRLARILENLLVEHKIIAANYFQSSEGEEGHPFLDASNHVEAEPSEFLSCTDVWLWLSLLKMNVNSPTSESLIYEAYQKCQQFLHHECKNCVHPFGCDFGHNLEEKLHHSIQRLKEAGFLDKLKKLSFDRIEKDRDVMDVLTKHMKVSNCYHFSHIILKNHNVLFGKALNYDTKVFRLPPIPLPMVLDKKRQTSEFKPQNAELGSSLIEVLKRKKQE